MAGSSSALGAKRSYHELVDDTHRHWTHVERVQKAAILENAKFQAQMEGIFRFACEPIRVKNTWAAHFIFGRSHDGMCHELVEISTLAETTVDPITVSMIEVFGGVVHSCPSSPAAGVAEPSNTEPALHES